MSILKKFNKYMLEHHPLTWHSKVIQLLVAGIFFWIVAYLSGYALTNLKVLKTEYLWRYYSNSYFVSFHVIYCLIVLSVWAVYFYKNNAIKSFYPLQRFYLIRLFLQLFVAFTVLVSADIAFTAGSFAKAKAILPEETFEQEIDDLNIATAFIVKDKHPYNFTYRKDVERLNYSYKKFKTNTNKWEESFEYYYYPEYLDRKYLGKNLPHRNFTDFRDSYVTRIDGEKYLFFSTTTRYDSPDSCESYSLVKDFHKLDHIENLHLYAIQNYNTSKYNYLHPENNKRFHRAGIGKIHRWAATNRKDSVARAILRAMDIMDKYKIGYELDPGLISTYLEAKDYIHINAFARSAYPWSLINGKRQFASRYPEEYAILMKYQDGSTVAGQDKEALIYAMELQDFISYEDEELGELISNYESAYQTNIFKNIFALLILSFSIAWLFIFFEFANIISLLISIPVGGVITILVAVLLLYVNSMMVMSHVHSPEDYDYHSNERISIALVFVICLLILIVTIAGVYLKNFSKKILNVLINLSYMIVPGFLSLLAGMINIFSGHYIYGKCDRESYAYDYSFLLEPWFGLLFAFIGVFIFFGVVIKWRAKEE